MSFSGCFLLVAGQIGVAQVIFGCKFFNGLLVSGISGAIPDLRILPGIISG